MSDQVKAWLDEEGAKVRAMKHWAEKEYEDPKSWWAEGPYPVMESLIAISNILLGACEYISKDRTNYPANIALGECRTVASSAIDKCEEEILK